MANSTVKDAFWIKGTNPQNLIEKIIRSRITESKFWKEECFALTSELLVDKAMALTYIGGIHSASIQATPFICLVLKMLQIQPEKDIVVEFIAQTDHKYVRALGAMYMRLTGTAIDCYKYLEPLYCDYKKLRIKKRDETFDVIHMDEFIDELLREERVLDIILPRIPKRSVLEQNNQLEPREMIDADVSDDELENGNQDKDDSPPKDYGAKRRRSPSKGRSRSRSVKRRKSRSKSRDRVKRRRDDDKDAGTKRKRSPSKERSRSRSVKRKKSRSKSRDRDREKERRGERRRSRDRHHRRDDKERDRDRERDRDGDKDRHKNRKERHRSKSKDRSRLSRSRERSRRRDDRHRTRRSRS